MSLPQDMDRDPERFTGVGLPANAHVAVLFCDSIGDFVVALPLLQAIRETYPESVVDYFGGDRTVELETSCSLINARCDLFRDAQSGLRDAVVEFCATRVNTIGPYDLTINLDNHPLAAWAAAVTRPRYVVGQCLSAKSRRLVPQPSTGIDGLLLDNWADDSLVERYPNQLRSQYIGDIFCAISHMPYPTSFPTPPMREPRRPIPQLLLGLGASRSAKLWPAGHWRQLIEHAYELGLSVGIIGAPERIQRKFYGSWHVEQELIQSLGVVDLRGKLTLPEVTGALSARAPVFQLTMASCI